MNEDIRKATDNAEIVKLRPADIKLTELGNAERLVARHGGDLRFCHPWRKWLVWDGRRWQPDATAEILRRAKETVRAMYGEAANEDHGNRRTALVAWAFKCEREASINAMVSLAKAEPGVPVLPEDLDKNSWLLNVLNGALDLRTGELQPHDPRDMLTKLVPVDYDADAQAPTWERFLGEIFDCNAGLIGFLQRAVGYSLTGSTQEHCFFYLYGTGSNGKSTFITTLSELLGDYAQATPTETFLSKNRGSSIPNDLARLKGARLVTAIEADEGRRFAESLVKTLTGGDVITARFLHAEFFEFVPEFKLWFAANHKLVVRGTGRAMWRRIKLVPFTITIPDEEQDRQLVDKLRAELPGILAWAVQGCLEWQQEGLQEPPEVTEATDAYRAEQDVVADFLSDVCAEEPWSECRAKELRAAYEEWCKQNGERPLSQKLLAPRLVERGFERVHRRDGWWWKGVTVRDPLNGG